MRLSNLHTDDSCYQSYRNAVPYLFIEAVIASNILSEAQVGRLSSLLQAGMAKLRNFLTPGAEGHLDMMLQYVAPKGGGINRVRELVQTAKELQEPIANNDNWWHMLFTTFGVQDQSVQTKVRQQVISATQTQQPGAMTHPKIAKIQDRLTKNKAAQQAAQQRLEDMRQQLATLRGQTTANQAGPVPPTQLADDYFRPIADYLFSEADVRSNLRFVASNLMRKIGYPSSVPTDTTDWLKKFMLRFANKKMDEGFGDWVQNFRHAVANPGYVAAKTNNYTMQHDNERAAKVAVKLLSDIIAKEVEERLRVANLTIQDVITAANDWNKYDAEYKQRKTMKQPLDKVFAQKYVAAKKLAERVTKALDPQTRITTS